MIYRIGVTTGSWFTDEKKVLESVVLKASKTPERWQEGKKP